MTEKAKCPLGMATCEILDGEPCSFFCKVVDRPAAELRLLLRRADAMEAAQAEARKLNGRALGAAMLNGKKP
jgi:hypothetical protein